jgi:hypothetical protein
MGVDPGLAAAGAPFDDDKSDEQRYDDGGYKFQEARHLISF